jgi:hypothetical protein
VAIPRKLPSAGSKIDISEIAAIARPSIGPSQYRRHSPPFVCRFRLRVQYSL